MATALSIAGVLIQLVGALVALRGLIKTHDAYAEKSIRTMVLERLARVRARIHALIDRLRRRPVHVEAMAGTAHGRGGAFGALASITWGPLAADMAVVDAIKELDRRVRDLLSRSLTLDQVVRDSSEENRAALEKLRADLESADQAAVGLVRHAAIEGLMGEAIGLILVIIGGVLQAWGAVLQAGASG